MLLFDVQFPHTTNFMVTVFGFFIQETDSCFLIYIAFPAVNFSSNPEEMPLVILAHMSLGSFTKTELNRSSKKHLKLTVHRGHCAGLQQWPCLLFSEKLHLQLLVQQDGHQKQRVPIFTAQAVKFVVYQPWQSMNIFE